MSGVWMEPEIAVVGGGPAGLCAAAAAASLGADVLVIDRSNKLGGQLVKQTHMFFGSKEQHASVRGIDIVEILCHEIDGGSRPEGRVRVLTDTTVLGLYGDGVLTADQNGKYIKIKPKATVVATGASEKFLSFAGNDLPGIYGAGAVQTLMNEHGVVPGQNALMIGSGNIGLIVSYQLMQAGVMVKAIVDAAPTIGGYLVHASKVRRMGIPIYTSHTVVKAHGTESLERATIMALDDKWQPVPGTEKDIDADILCISVGLSPLAELLWQAGCRMQYISELGGHVPLRDDDLQTSVPGVYVAGDVAGVEEASSAMVEGRLAGLCAARRIGHDAPDFDQRREACRKQLHDLRKGPVGVKIRSGLMKALIRTAEENIC